MGRLVAFNALFFLLPFAVYGGWLAVRREPVGAAASWPPRVMVGLCLAGIVTCVIGLLLVTSFGGAAPGANYRPATVQDGRLVPGHFE